MPGQKRGQNLKEQSGTRDNAMEYKNTTLRQLKKKTGWASPKEKELMEISLRLHKAREKNGKSQSELAKEAHLTQQQLSKVENGVSCNIKTFIKACHANGYKLELKPYNRRRTVATG